LKPRAVDEVKPLCQQALHVIVIDRAGSKATIVPKPGHLESDPAPVVDRHEPKRSSKNHLTVDRNPVTTIAAGVCFWGLARVLPDHDAPKLQAIQYPVDRAHAYDLNATGDRFTGD
jgi:hypothetical protein